jgi:hypothetical protein
MIVQLQKRLITVALSFNQGTIRQRGVSVGGSFFLPDLTSVRRGLLFGQPVPMSETSSGAKSNKKANYACTIQ